MAFRGWGNHRTTQCCLDEQTCQMESDAGGIERDSRAQIDTARMCPLSCGQHRRLLLRTGKFVDGLVGLFVAQNRLNVFTRLRKRN